MKTRIVVENGTTHRYLVSSPLGNDDSNGVLHCEDGPAVENLNGYKSWWQNGIRHRIDGPAVEFSKGGREYWIDGHVIHVNSLEEFLEHVKFWRVQQVLES